jgi:hypothetical protein
MNKFWKSIIFLSIVFLVFKISTYNTPTQFYADIPLLSLVMALFVKFRKQIAEKIRKMSLPKFVSYLLIWVPISIFEENINCLPTGCKLVPPTIPILFIFGLILGLLVIWLKPKRVRLPLILFSTSGLLFEIFVGGLQAGIFNPVGMFFSLWTVIGYAFIAIIPLTILVDQK